MNNEKSYTVESQQEATKRVCLTLDLKNDPDLIRDYMAYHSPEKHWMEIADGIRKSGVLVMDIYRIDNRLFMICEVPEAESFDTIWYGMGEFPRQSEWAELMGKFQQAIPGHELEWVKMERIYSLY